MYDCCGRLHLFSACKRQFLTYASYFSRKSRHLHLPSERPGETGCTTGKKDGNTRPTANCIS